MSEAAPAADLEKRRSLLDRFERRVNQAQLANPPPKTWVKRALRREGAPRCPVRLKSLSYDVILRYGDELADLLISYPDDIVAAQPYEFFVGYSPSGRDGAIDTTKVLTEAAQWTDEWGTRWEHAAGGVGASPVEVPIQDWSQLDEYLAHRLPDPALPGRLNAVGPALDLHGRAKYFVGQTHMALFERLHCLRGMERTLEDFYAAPDQLGRLLDALTNYYLGIIQAWAELPGVDAIFWTDDWGTELSLMVAPDMWRRFFAARYRRLSDEAHRFGLAVAFHSCGNVLPIIGDLIDAGVDIIHPLQPDAMDLRDVAREFGGKVAFWGGLSDKAIAVATPAQVRAEVLRAIDLLGAPYGNAYIPCLANVMMPEVPLDNIVALFEACHGR